MTPTARLKAGSLPLNYAALRVLLVDDDDFQIDLIAENLRDLGVIDISKATSGAKALQQLAAKGSRYHLILLDLHMPGMDGFQFMESLAHAGYTGTLALVSGQSGDVLHAAALVAQLRRFTLLGALAKPVNRAALSALLAQVRG